MLLGQPLKRNISVNLLRSKIRCQQWFNEHGKFKTFKVIADVGKK